MSLRGRILRLERECESPRIIGASVIPGGLVREILLSDGVARRAESGMTEADLPAGCRVVRYDPAEEIVMLYRDRFTGKADYKSIEAVSEYEFMCEAPPC